METDVRPVCNAYRSDVREWGSRLFINFFPDFAKITKFLTCNTGGKLPIIDQRLLVTRAHAQHYFTTP